MAISGVLKVDINVATAKLNTFMSISVQLGNVMVTLKGTIDMLAMVAWVSPAALALKKKFDLLYKQCEEALKKAKKYVEDLQVMIESYTSVENKLEETAKSLKTEVFNI